MPMVHSPMRLLRLLASPTPWHQVGTDAGLGQAVARGAVMQAEQSKAAPPALAQAVPAEACSSAGPSAAAVDAAWLGWHTRDERSSGMSHAGVW